MASSLLPEQHPERVQLHNEIHARPAEIIEAPLAITHIVMLTDAAQREASRAHVAALLRDHHRPLPDAATTHVLIDLGAFRLRWEQHTEFVAWTFATPMEPSSVADMREPETAINAVPQSWLRKLPGQCLSSLHLWALSEARSTRRNWCGICCMRTPWWAPVWQAMQAASIPILRFTPMAFRACCCWPAMS